jgi:hypothetical protein
LKHRRPHRKVSGLFYARSLFAVPPAEMPLNQEKTMLYVKIMSGEGRPDADPFSNYAIIPVANNESIRFISNVVPDGQEGNHDGERFTLEVQTPEGGVKHHPLTGNAYVMNEVGKTIASHGS